MAPDAVSSIGELEQVVSFAMLTDIVGKGVIVITVVPVFVQPFTSVPVTVYVVLAVGEAFTIAPVVALSPEAGAQVYVEAPEAVSVKLFPKQRNRLAGLIATGGGVK